MVVSLIFSLSLVSWWSLEGRLVSDKLENHLVNHLRDQPTVFVIGDPMILSFAYKLNKKINKRDKLIKLLPIVVKTHEIKNVVEYLRTLSDRIDIRNILILSGYQMSFEDLDASTISVEESLSMSLAVDDIVKKGLSQESIDRLTSKNFSSLSYRFISAALAEKIKGSEDHFMWKENLIEVGNAIKKLRDRCDFVIGKPINKNDVKEISNIYEDIVRMRRDYIGAFAAYNNIFSPNEDLSSALPLEEKLIRFKSGGVSVNRFEIVSLLEKIRSSSELIFKARTLLLERNLIQFTELVSTQSKYTYPLRSCDIVAFAIYSLEMFPTFDLSSEVLSKRMIQDLNLYPIYFKLNAQYKKDYKDKVISKVDYQRYFERNMHIPFSDQISTQRIHKRQVLRYIDFANDFIQKFDKEEYKEFAKKIFWVLYPNLDISRYQSKVQKPKHIQAIFSLNSFRQVLKKNSYDYLFKDLKNKDFGDLTEKGGALMSDTIFERLFLSAGDSKPDMREESE